MNSKSLLLIVFVFSNLIFGQSVDLRIKGKILGSDGKPMPIANIYFGTDQFLYLPTAQSIPVSPDGSFDFKITKPAYYTFSFAGLGHSIFQISLPIFEVKGTTEIEVTLSAEKSFIYPNFIAFKSNIFKTISSSEIREADKDGKFRLQIWKPIDTLLVQISPKPYYISAGFAYPGASYLPDGAGNYYTTFYNVKPGFEVVIDKTKLPKNSDYNLPRLRFINDIAGVKPLYETSERAFIEARATNASYLKYYDSIFTSTSDKTLKDLVAMKLMGEYFLNETSFFSFNIETLLNAVGPDNYAWNKYGLSVRDISEFYNKEGQATFLTKLFEKQNIDIKAIILYYLKEKGNIVSNKEYIRMYKEFKDLVSGPESDYQLSDLMPKEEVIDEPIKDFSLKLLDGKNFSPKDLVGKYFVINFWGTWCYPCILEIPNLQKAYSKFKDKGFEIVNIAVKSSMEDLNKQLKETSMPWSQALLDEDSFVNLDGLFNLQFLPKMLLVSPEGKVIALEDVLTGGKLEKKLEEVFKIK
jgi:thiol-disulfide isomerase/thioredoxin